MWFEFQIRKQTYQQQQSSLFLLGEDVKLAT